MNTLSVEPELPDNIQPKGIHPQRFALWVGMASLTMLFAALTSAYIVREGAGNWVEFEIPKNFFVSGGLLLLSSVTMWWAVRSFKQDKLASYRLALSLTLTLAFAFCVSQYMGWIELQKIGMYIEGNPSGSFIYVISFIHIAHVGVGLVLLFATYLRSFILFKNPAKWLIWHQNINKSIRIELLATYWHFVDVLWLYLLGFFYFF
jgi:cytochrome c oxidase subunit III